MRTSLNFFKTTQLKSQANAYALNIVFRRRNVREYLFLQWRFSWEAYLKKSLKICFISDTRPVHTCPYFTMVNFKLKTWKFTKAAKNKINSSHNVSSVDAQREVCDTIKPHVKIIISFADNSQCFQVLIHNMFRSFDNKIQHNL